MSKRKQKETNQKQGVQRILLRHFMAKSSREMEWEWNQMSTQKFCIVYFFHMGEIEAACILHTVNYIVQKEKLMEWEREKN